MPVQIEPLKRYQNAEQSSVGQVSTQTADTTAPQQVINKAVNGFGEAAIKYLDEQDKNAASLAATKAGLDFGSRYKGELGKLKSLKGDPTEPYAKFDEAATGWETDVLGQYEGASERTKKAVREQILKTKWQLEPTRQTSQNLQYQAYDENTTNASIALKKDNALSSIETLSAKTPEDFKSSLVPFQLQINGIHDDIITRGKRTGLVKVDAEGNEKYDPIILEKINKETSDVVVNSVKTLNAVGKTAEAKALVEEYGDQLTAKAKADLTKGVKESGLENEAFAMAAKYQNLPPDVALSKINALPGDTGEQIRIKDKAAAHVMTFKKRMDEAQKLRSEQSRERLSKYVSDTKFIDMNELENDEVYKRLKGTLSSKDDAAIRQQVEQPKTSDSDVKTEVFQLAFDGKMTDMTYGELNEKMVGLSKSDRVIAERMWRTANDETRGEKNAATRYMGTTLRAQLQEAGVIKVNTYGKYSNADQVKFTRASARLMEKIESLPKNTSMADQNRFVQQFVQDEIKTGVFDVNSPLPAQQKLKSAAPVPRKDLSVNTPPPALTTVTKEQSQEFFAAFAREKGRSWDPTKSDDRVAYNAFKSRGGKL